MKQFRFGIALLLAAIAAHALAAPVMTRPQQSPVRPEVRRNMHRRDARHQRPAHPARPVKGGIARSYPSVKGVVAPDFKMNTDSLPMFLGRDGLAAATLPNGSFICTWVDYRDGNWNIRFQWFTHASQPASAVFTADAGNTYQFVPCVAARANGAFIVSWQTWDDAGHPHLYCRAFDSSNNPLDTTIRVDVNNTGNASNPSLAASDSGYAVVWNDDHDLNYKAYLQMLDTMGHLVGLASRVFTVGGNLYAQQMNPKVQRVGQGFVVVCDDNGGPGNNVYARRYDALGDTIGPVFQVNSADTKFQAYPALCATDSGFTIAWDDWRNSSNRDIYLQRFDTAGAYLGGNVNVSNLTTDASYPSIASCDGRTVVAWQHNASGTYDVYAQWFKPNGDTLGGQVKLDDDPSNFNQQQRPIALASDSGWNFYWQDDRNNGVTVIYGQGYDTSLAAQGANVMLSDSTAGLVSQEYPAVAAGQDGNFLAVWYDYRNIDGNNSDIYGRLYSGNGAALTPDFLISDTSYSSGDRSAEDPKVKGLADGSYLVAWYDYRNGSDNDIYGQRLDAAGNPIGGNYKISTTDPGYNDYDMSIAAADSGYGVFWYAYDPGYSHSCIYGRVFKTNGDSVGTTTMINDTVSQSYVPSAAATDSGLVVIWEDRRDNSYYHMYGQRVSWDGNLSGANYLIGDSLDVDQYDPSLAGTNKGFMATWYSYNGVGADIVGQRLDAAGQKADSNFTISTEPSWYHEEPSVTVSPDGNRYAVFWYAGTGSKDVLLSQRYQNGQPQGVNEMLVDTINWSWAEMEYGQNIAATNDRLFFTWYGVKNGSHTLDDAYGMVTDWYARAMPPVFAWVDSLHEDADSAYGPYPVKAVITDDGSVEGTVLHYQVNGGGWDSLEMAAGAADTFSAIIPEQVLALGDTVTISYYVWAIDNASNWIASTTHSFRLTHVLGIAGLPGTALPKVYALRSCYPNPSSGRVSFGYQLPKLSNVSLTVYNIAGQVVKRFDQGTQPAGSYSINWNDARVSAGVYIYRLQAGDFVSTKKLTIVR